MWGRVGCQPPALLLPTPTLPPPFLPRPFHTRPSRHPKSVTTHPASWSQVGRLKKYADIVRLTTTLSESLMPVPSERDLSELRQEKHYAIKMDSDVVTHWYWRFFHFIGPSWKVPERPAQRPVSPGSVDGSRPSSPEPRPSSPQPRPSSPDPDLRPLSHDKLFAASEPTAFAPESKAFGPEPAPSPRSEPAQLMERSIPASVSQPMPTVAAPIAAPVAAPVAAEVAHPRVLSSSAKPVKLTLEVQNSVADATPKLKLVIKASEPNTSDPTVISASMMIAPTLVKGILKPSGPAMEALSEEPAQFVAPKPIRRSQAGPALHESALHESAHNSGDEVVFAALRTRDKVVA
mmetsp:Transcript_47017/g.93678  ORF Transcript_47017/g.93678 Transcript_47017/m.93678 type:complete len:348 (+) Transcript_47017:834-1877(+)